MTEQADAATQVERTARHSTVLDWSVRAGLVAYGALHLLLAWVALRLVTGHGSGSGSATGQGALAQLADDSLGRLLLSAMALMFGGLAVWQLIVAFVGYRRDVGLKRHLMRIGAASRVVVYGYLAFASARLATQGGSGSGQSPDSTTHRVMAAPAGTFILVAVGVAAAAIGIGLAVFGLTKSFLDQLDSQARNADRRVPIVVLGQVGYVVKGVAFVLIGVLVVLAAVTRTPGKVGGLDQSFYELLGHTAGSVAVIVAGLGIGCFGLYLFARSRHLAEHSLTS